MVIGSDVGEKTEYEISGLHPAYISSLFSEERFLHATCFEQ